MAKLSVLVLCTGDSGKLERALICLTRQTLMDIEIVPVDCGLTEICKETLSVFSNANSRVKSIFSNGTNFAAAINYCIRNSAGRYVAIFRSQDLIIEDYYWILCNEAIANNLDVCGVNGHIESLDELHNFINDWSPKEHEFLSIEQKAELLGTGNVHICRYVFRKEFLVENQIFLNQSLSNCHEIQFVCEVLLSAKYIKIIQGAGYFISSPNYLLNACAQMECTQISVVVDEIRKICALRTDPDCVQAGIHGYCVSNLFERYLLLKETLNDDRILKSLSEKIHEISISSSSTKIMLRAMQISKIQEEFDFSIETEPVAKTASNNFSRINFNKFDNIKYFHQILSEVYYNIYLALGSDSIELLYPTCRQVIDIFNNFPSFHKSKPVLDFCRYILATESFRIENFCLDDPEIFLLIALYLSKYDDLSLRVILPPLFSRNSGLRQLAGTIPELNSIVRNEFRLPDELQSRRFFLTRDRIDSNRAEFETHLRGKSVAIVGNASNEMGTGNGHEIDSHDLVIRFNNYSTAPNYAIDYGSKTTVWAITPAIETIYEREDIAQFDFIVSPRVHLKTATKRIPFFYNLCISGIRYLDFEGFEARVDSNLCVPSVGLYVLMFLRKRLSLLRNVNMYGFSPNTANEQNRHYFLGDPTPTSKTKFHKWDVEQSVMEQIKSEFQSHNSRI